MSEEVRWIADEMVGKLARYLRFLGYDVYYARGMMDLEILEMARASGRTILTRDELLAHRGGPRAIRIRSTEILGQLAEVREAFPSLRKKVTFVRCSTCNGQLVLADRSTPAPPKGVPEDVWISGAQVHVCKECNKAYWEGTHTAEIRETFARVFGA